MSERIIPFKYKIPEYFHLNISAIKLKRVKGLKLNFLSLLYFTYPTSNAKSLASDTPNEHALTCTRETCSCSQTAVQWNQWQ